MTKGTIFSNSWLMGVFAAFLVMTAAFAMAMTDGLSLQAGDVEMKVEMTADHGAVFRFAHAEK